MKFTTLSEKCFVSLVVPPFLPLYVSPTFLRSFVPCVNPQVHERSRVAKEKIRLIGCVRRFWCLTLDFYVLNLTSGNY